ncbi:sensor histidine kinase [Streptomyces cyaneofuscatus]|uniref:sensor histidine kinase n=1 Tax=Streptomyces cyaneofuscatus TaxID=66883 RepID=UPI002953B129|nr:sensor histidine kinase [Streptomyces cyaneofuscatus]WOP11514.1 sensor histidine kinase [Streptomyces cyaneofuscatus]
MTFDRLAARVRALPPLVADLAVVAVVGLFTASDVAVNDPGYRQDDALTWVLLVVSLAALVFRRRRPVTVACVTGAACAGWAKEAVRELRATLSVLRETESTAPAPRLDQLAELVEGVEAGGVRVALRRTPSGAAYPAVVEATAYRIVQEALTNVIKHSGAGRVAASLTGTDTALHIEIVDDGPPRSEPSAPDAADGFGLIGMRERVLASPRAGACSPRP